MLATMLMGSGPDRQDLVNSLTMALSGTLDIENPENNVVEKKRETMTADQIKERLKAVLPHGV